MDLHLMSKSLFTLKFVGFWGLLSQIGVPCLDPQIRRFGKNYAHINAHCEAPAKPESSKLVNQSS